MVVATVSDTIRCQKCGGTDVLVRYHPDASWKGCRTATGQKFSWRNTEHLHMTCRTCQWDWCEATKDSR